MSTRDLLFERQRRLVSDRIAALRAFLKLPHDAVRMHIEPAALDLLVDLCHLAREAGGQLDLAELVQLADKIFTDEVQLFPEM